MTAAPDPVPTSCPPAWAHAAGALSLGRVAPVPTEWQQVADRLMVHETAARYSLAYDERRLDILEDLFAEDAVFAFSVSGGGADRQVGRDAVIAWLHDIMQTQDDQRRHVMGNLIVEELTADTADVTSYFALFASDTETHLMTTGFYRMQLVKREGCWRIAHVYDGLDRPF